MEAENIERISLPEIDLCLLPWRSLSGGGDDPISDHRQLYLESQQFKKLREACQHLGHFCVANHGVHHDLIHSALNLNGRNSLAKLKLEMADLSQRIVKLIICSLGLDVSKHYNSQPFVSFEDLLRVACYKEEEAEAEAEAKRNLGCISLRYMEDAGVFYVRRNCGNWIEAAASAGSFMVDLGASLHIWTNGRYLSTQHRIMPSHNPKARPCITYFLDFSESSQICCPPELVDEDNKDKYPPHALAQLH